MNSIHTEIRVNEFKNRFVEKKKRILKFEYKSKKNIFFTNAIIIEFTMNLPVHERKTGG
jgi:hypothetical protein